jgi:hypothetical protein
VLAGVGVLGLDDERERADRLQVRRLQLAEGELQLLGARALPLVDLGDVAREDQQLPLKGLRILTQRRKLGEPFGGHLRSSAS